MQIHIGDMYQPRIKPSNEPLNVSNEQPFSNFIALYDHNYFFNVGHACGHEIYRCPHQKLIAFSRAWTTPEFENKIRMIHTGKTRNMMSFCGLTFLVLTVPLQSTCIKIKLRSRELSHINNYSICIISLRSYCDSQTRYFSEISLIIIDDPMQHLLASKSR